MNKREGRERSGVDREVEIDSLRATDTEWMGIDREERQREICRKGKERDEERTVAHKELEREAEAKRDGQKEIWRGINGEGK